MKRAIPAFTFAFLPCLALAQTAVTIHPGAYYTALDEPYQSEDKIRATAGNATFVDEKQWANQRAQTVKDMVDYTAGVFTQQRNGAESARLSIRGSGLANAFQGRGLLILQDGIPINTADGEFEFAVIDPWLVRYAEVYPGANALEFGASNFGGAINFVTPTGQSAKGDTFRAEAGSFGTLHGQYAMGREWNGGDVFAAVTGFSQDGFREQNEQQTGRFTANLGMQVNEHFSNRIYISHTFSDAEIPGTLSLSEIRSNPRQANPRNLAGDYRRNLDITRIANKSAWESGEDRVETTLFYTYRHLDNPVTTYEYQHNNDVGLRTKYAHRYGKSQWVVGMNHQYGEVEETRQQNIAGNNGARILARNLYASTHEAYAQIDQQLAGTLYGIAGVQAAYAVRDIHEAFPTTNAQDEYYTGFSPRVGLRYYVDAQRQLFANLSRSFEPPGSAELSGGNVPGFKKLNAQRATTAEMGARGETEGIGWQAAYFHGWLKNEFVNYRFADGTTNTINAASSTRDGVELAAHGRVKNNLFLTGDGVSLRGAYTYSRYALDNDPLYGDNTLPGVPEHYLRAEVLYEHPSGLSFGPNVEWSPADSPIDLTHSLNAPSYTLLGARALWQNDEQTLNFYVEGRNLLNKNYVATYNVIPDAQGRDGRNFYPGEGRAIYTGFRVHF